MAKTIKKRNPADLTSRNTRARVKAEEKLFKKIGKLIIAIDKRLVKVEARLSTLDGYFEMTKSGKTSRIR